MEFKQVDKAEFEAFIEKYPAYIGHNNITSSPNFTVHYNDFKRGKFPDSVIARMVKTSKGEMKIHVKDCFIVPPPEEEGYEYFILDSQS